jgi:hypothetical protein
MESVLTTVVVPLLIGFAGNVLAAALGRRRAVALAVGAFSAATFIVVALLLPPYRVLTADWCAKVVGIQVEGRLGTFFLGWPVEGPSVHLKVYEEGGGDPPVAGPKTASTDARGHFRSELQAARLDQSRSYVLNVVYFYDTFLGEQWRKHDFKRPAPSQCLS